MSCPSPSPPPSFFSNLFSFLAFPGSWGLFLLACALFLAPGLWMGLRFGRTMRPLPPSPRWRGLLGVGGAGLLFWFGGVLLVLWGFLWQNAMGAWQSSEVHQLRLGCAGLSIFSTYDHTFAVIQWVIGIGFLFALLGALGGGLWQLLLRLWFGRGQAEPVNQ